MMKRILCLLLCLMLTFSVCHAAPADDWRQYPYWIGVDKTAQRVTIYSTADNHVIYRWKCSTATVFGATPRGTFYMPEAKYSTERTDALMYAVNGLYFTWGSRITTSGILFHSVTFNGPSWSDLDTEAIDRLGQRASHGCIRLDLNEARWIAENCPPGTRVIIHDNSTDRLILNALGEASGTEEVALPNRPTGISLLLNGTDAPADIVLEKGETLQLSSVLQPADASAQVAWIRSNSCVSVDRNGLVTGLKSGIVTVSAVTADGLRDSITVQVNDPDVPRRIELDTDSAITMDLGDSLQVNATVIPQTAPATLTWRSSSPYVTVQNGLITPKRKGDYTVTVTAAVGVKATIRLHVIDTKTPTGIALDRTGTVTMNLGETLQLTPTLSPATAVTTLKWAPASGTVVSVAQDGTVTAKKTGIATVSVTTANGKKASVIVKVVDPTIPAGITLDRSGTVTLNLGETLALSAVMTPDTAVSDIKWTSSLPRIASVDAQGVVSPLKEGIAKITATTRNGRKAFVTVKVVDPTIPAGITLDRSGTVTLNLGETLALSAVMTPDTAVSDIKWTSSLPRIASVDAEGVVTPLKEGTTKITAATRNGKKAWVTIKVVDPTIPTGITLDQSGTVTVNLGETLPLSAVMTPDTAVSTIRWTSSAPRIASVDTQGVVTSLKTGTAKITAATRNGKTASVTVKVVDPTIPTGVTLDVPAAITMTVGETLSLTAQLQPVTAQTTLHWSTMAATVCTVDQDGVVTALRTGRAQIYVRTANGKTASTLVTVVKTPATQETAVSIATDTDLPDSPATATDLPGTLPELFFSLPENQDTLCLQAGEQLDLSRLLQGAEPGTPCRWYTDRPDLASVDDTGLVTAVAPGTVIIRVIQGERSALISLCIHQAPATATDLTD